MEINVISGALYTQDGKKIADVEMSYINREQWKLRRI